MDQQRVDWINQFLSSEYIGEFIHLLSVDELNKLFDQLRQYNKYLSSLAHQDALTKLPNRYFFDLSAKRILAQTKRRNQKAALLYLDLDGFKKINDLNGHAVGDQILCEVADVLRVHTREEDLIARIGGDEFVIVMPCIQAYTDAGSLGSKLISAINLIQNKYTLTTGLSCSIGISGCPIAGTTVEDLVEKADSALYRVKNRGGSHVEYHSDKVNKEFKYKEKISQSIQKIIATKKVSLAYIPIYQFNDNRMRGMLVNISESSSSWLLFRIKDLLAADFTDSALDESIGLSYLVKIYNEFTQYNQIQSNNHTLVFIEISRQMIFNNEFFTLFESFLSNNTKFTSSVVLSILVREIDDNLVSEIQKLKKMGVRICYVYVENDTFDMMIFNDYCPDYINLSMEVSFLREMNVGLVKATISFLKNMGISIIFSDINSNHYFKKAKEIEPDYVCGTELSLPMTQSELMTHL